jgi:two-component system, OmpR family, sensor histidine kinase KdpD
VIQRVLRFSIALGSVALVTTIGYVLLPVNSTTQGFAYVLLVLVIASYGGFAEACVASVAAMLAFNFFFLEPVLTFTITDPRNWVALFSFLATSLIASRLSAKAEKRALDALARQEDLERLYTFSRAILLIEPSDSFPKQLAQKTADIFSLSAVVLYERRSDEFYRAGPKDFDGLDDQLREAALQGTSFADAQLARTITAVRLGAEPIAALALQGSRMPDTVTQGIANLVAIGLERARTQDLAAQVEAVRQSEALRTTIIDAMAHELKTPLTSIMAATTALLADADDPNRGTPESRTELIRIANEETRRLKNLIDESIEMARLDTAEIQVHPEPSDVSEVVREVAEQMRSNHDSRPIEIAAAGHPRTIAIDRRLVRMAIKQLVDNALKYSPPDQPVQIAVHDGGGVVTIAVTDHGKGIPVQEQKRIFERLYRSPTVQHRVPGSGLGLSIARNIVRAHHGDLSVTSHPGETTFRLTLPEQGAAE